MATKVPFLVAISSRVWYPDQGTPQGGVVSPLLSNVFLHEVLDTWFHQLCPPAPAGARLPGALCRRCGAGLRIRGRRAAGLGGAPEAFREIRPDPPPGENATGGVPPAASGCPTDAGPVLRHAGLHSLLGAVPDGPLGGAAQDGLGSSESSAAAHGPVVPSPPPRARGGPTGGAEPTAARSLPVLRGDRQRTRLSHLPPAGPTPVADLAESALAGSPPELGGVSASPPPLSPHPTARRPQHSPSGSESVGRGAGCPNWARPDLWEPREGNLPGPPGYQRFGPVYVRRLRRRRGRMGDTWHLDEVFVTIQGRQQYLWRAVDEDGDVLDILVQSHRNRRAAVRFFRTLLKAQGRIPRRLITDQLRSYAAAGRTVMPSVVHVTDQCQDRRHALRNDVLRPPRTAARPSSPVAECRACG